MDKECGEIPVALVVKRRGRMLTQAAIIDHVAEQVSLFRANGLLCTYARTHTCAC